MPQNSIPQARVVRKAGQLMTPPPTPRSDQPGPIMEQLRTAAAVAIGLWPLTGVLMLMLILLYFAGNANAP